MNEEPTGPWYKCKDGSVHYCTDGQPICGKVATVATGVVNSPGSHDWHIFAVPIDTLCKVCKDAVVQKHLATVATTEK